MEFEKSSITQISFSLGAADDSLSRAWFKRISTTMLARHNNKFLLLDDVSVLRRAQSVGCIDVVLVSGRFYAGIQPNHLTLFRQAHEISDVGIVVCAINSTESLGDDPLYEDVDRVQHASYMEYVDFVVLFDEPTPADLCKRLNPMYLVKGPDWRDRVHEMPEAPHCSHIVFAQEDKDYHTSDKIGKI